MNLTRRTALKGGASALALGSLAGCLDDVADDSAGFDSAYAAFFALADWSQAVAGEQAAIENPVDFGQLGHGWEPDGDLPREVASTDAFVYLDTPEFSWAQDLASTLEADYESVEPIDALEGLESAMIESGHDHEGADEHEDDQHDEEGTHEDEDDQHDEETHEDDQHNGTEDDHGTEDDGHEDDAHGSDGEIDRGQLDPHVWVDPVLAQEMLDTIAAGFADIDPENSEIYEANAADYTERLADLDSAFETMVEEAERSTVVLATHSSFAYVEARYDLDIHTVAGISPDASPSQSEISETLDLVDESGIDVILYDRFESDRLANTIVENSDSATETMAVTAGAGTLREWDEEGLGFVDQMEQITLPAFRRALGAE